MVANSPLSTFERTKNNETVQDALTLGKILLNAFSLEELNK